MGEDKKMRGGVWSNLTKLNYVTPSPLLPHGISGILLIVVGAALVAGSLSGEYWLIKDTAALLVYCLAAGTNALTGIIMAPRSKVASRLAFRVASTVQLALVWCVWRMRPLPSHASEHGGGDGSESDAAAAAAAAASGSNSSGSQFRTTLARTLDVVAAAALLAGNAAIFYTAVTKMYKTHGAPLAAAVCGGVFGLLLLSAYPVHLAIGGNAWLECLEETYPAQRVGFSGYVYVPATFVLAAMMFGATLVERKIITEVQFGVVFGGCVASILVVTVIVQEVHIPVVSTQRLILPCPPAAPGSLLEMVGDALDTSALAQNVLQVVAPHVAQPI